MDEANFVLLTAAGEAKLETIIKRLKEEEIPYELKDLPKGDTPALGSIVRTRQEILIPEEHLMKGRDMVNAINSGGFSETKGSPSLKRFIIIMINLIIIAAFTFFIYQKYFS